MAETQTTQGRVSSIEEDGIQIFWGIPFAAPPTGDLRFKAPEPGPAWSGTRLCDRPGPASLQSDHPIPGFSAEDPREEDCLYLNVFTPAIDDNKRPVMVWIHGGGYTHGCSHEDLYSGSPLAKRGDVVIVSINYRLGALGFLHLKEHLPDEGLASNLGLLDCIAALEWVRANIGQFGGDKDNVTIFGESAGAAAVGTILAMPMARGLFNRAILQSGQGRALPPELAKGNTDKLLADLDLAPTDAAALLSIPAERIVAAQTRLTAKGTRFSPVKDPDTLPEQPLMAIAAGAAESVDLLIGYNRDEQKLFQMGAGRREAIGFEEAVSQIRPSLPGVDDDALEVIVETYRISRRDNGLADSYLDVADAIIGDVMFRVGGVALAEAQTARGGKAFMYLFTHESPARGGSLRACHALEIPFVFGTTGQPAQVKFAGSGDKVKELSHQMMEAWLNFARHSDPSHEGIGTWSPYDPEHRITMLFGPETGPVSDPLPAERRILSR